MTEKFQFELVSPEKKLMSEDITMTVIPGTEGDFGVLSGHAPLVASVRAGVVDIYRDTMDEVSTRIFIAGGVADVTGNQCTVLAEQAINVNDLDKGDIEKQIADLEQDLQAVSDEVDQLSFHKKLDILKAMAQSAA